MTVYECVVTALLCACAAHCVLLDAASILVLLRKARLYALGLLAMAVGRDKRWRSRRVDARTVRAARLVESKRLVFVRHGESEWNRIFNVGPKALAPFKLAIALLREGALLLRGDPGSVFLDAPLTTLGLEQAQAVAALLRGPPAGPAAALELATLRGDATAPRTSVVVSSNLRRAAQTAALAFQHRLRGGEAVRVLSCLQEISNNVDAVALAPPGAAPDLPRVPAPLRGPGAFDGAGNLGTKPPRGDGRRRLEAFCAYALAADEGCVVAVGHSLWFRSFFDEFLPSDAAHVARVAKIRNGGVVACDLESRLLPSGVPVFSIPPDSVAEIHLGFDVDKLPGRARRGSPAARPLVGVPPARSVVLSPIRPARARDPASPPRGAKLAL